MVDDMGYAGLSCFGNPHFKTPELDRLAEEGIRFTISIPRERFVLRLGPDCSPDAISSVPESKQ